MGAFDKKMANVRAEAKAGRSKLAAQAAAQDKKFREYANNKIKEEVAKTSAEFHDVRDQMAKDRAHADAELSHASARMDAALNAQKALQDKRFAQTVADIAEAKKEANDRVEKFRTSFKVDILSLQGTVDEQTRKLNARTTQLAGVVTSNKLEQARVNAAVDAELKRMVKIGDERYKEHLKKDEELHSLMAKNKEATATQMEQMAEEFTTEMTKIKDQMAKDRAHAENSLSTATSALYKTLADNQEAQDAANKELTEATRRAKLDAEAALAEAKEGFSGKLANMHSTVEDLEKQHNTKIQELTGVVQENAVKDAGGREELRKIAEFNKNTLKSAVKDAVAKGEARALEVEAKMKDINAKTRTQMNNRITTEISTLEKDIHAQIFDLTLETKEARAEMKKEILYAVQSAEELAKENLKKMVEWSEGEFTKLNANLEKEESKSEEERAALAASIAAEKKHALDALSNAVSAQNKALLTFTQETKHEIKKTNTQLAAHASTMIKNAEDVREQMKANIASIGESLEAARASAQAELGAVSTASAARFSSVIKAVEDGLETARASADAKFSQVYIDMATNRREQGEALAAAVVDLNDSIAKRSALEDERFSKTVKDLASARSEAHQQVVDAQKQMKADIVAATELAKAAEERVIGDIQVVSAMIISDKAAQVKVQKIVDAEIASLVTLSDKYYSESKSARGVIKKILDENKAAAAEEVKQLAFRTKDDLEKLDSTQAAYLSGFRSDLTDATKSLYEKLAKDKESQDAAMGSLEDKLATSQAATAAALSDATELFDSRVMSLTNAITANKKYYTDKLADKTGLILDWKKGSEQDRKDIRLVRDAMVANLHVDIQRAIDKGEAEMKAVEERAMANVATEKKALLTTIAESVENMADNIFKAVQENRQKVADNYLSLKAYAATAADLIVDYVEAGKGRNLSSIGDLLQTMASMEDMETAPADGEGFGADHIPLIFSGETVEVDDSVSKINGLVNEYMQTIGQVKARWPLGLGKYLIAKLEIAMQGTGALEVDKVADKAGNFVFMNAHAVGLSSKLADFEELAVRMTSYESQLAKMTGTLAAVHGKTAGKVTVPPPEWQGD
jgi:hypothetical protein